MAQSTWPKNTLADIQTKVRRITRSPSEAQLTTDQLNTYINTGYLYDLPSNLRLFPLRTNLTFYTQPGVDVYSSNNIPNDPLFNFKNRYIAVHQPVFMAGVQCPYTQDRNSFYASWPQTNSIVDTTLRGTGGTGPFTGVAIPRFILQGSVIFTCLDVNGTGMILVDTPVNNVMGNLYVPENQSVIYGTINYLTGAYTFNFPNNTMLGATVWIEDIVYQPGKPVAMLYFADQFTIRPVPDKVYSIQIEVDLRPTELLQMSDSPLLEQWWQYLAYVAAKKIFEDRMDYDSLNLMLPSLNEQERLCLRTTLEQQANMRAPTIYSTGGQNAIPGWFGATWPY